MADLFISWKKTATQKEKTMQQILFLPHAQTCEQFDYLTLFTDYMQQQNWIGQSQVWGQGYRKT